MKQIYRLLTLALVALMIPVMAKAGVDPSTEAVAEHTEAHEAEAHEKEGVDAQGIIFDHLGDRYGWEVPFNHHNSIPLPIIVWGSDGLHVFSSNREEHAKTYRDGNCEFLVAGADSP